jgi:hypothetical protein
MNAQDSDGIDEALQGVTHVAMTAAARMGEQLARMREQLLRNAQARSAQAARERNARMTAEREAARAFLAPVHRSEWWDTTRSEDVTKAYQVAAAWSEVDPEAMRAEQRIVEEVRNRYGIDVACDGGSVRMAEVIDRAEHARAQAAKERAAGGRERAEAVNLVARANAVDSASEVEARIAELVGTSDRALFDAERLDDTDNPVQAKERVEEAEALSVGIGRGALSENEVSSGLRSDAGAAYDSAERREAMARGLGHIENRVAADARVRSDVAQGRPATAAVANTPVRAPKARKTKSGPDKSGSRSAHAR